MMPAERQPSDSNPYTSPTVGEASLSSPPVSPGTGLIKCLVLGAIGTVVASIPLAGAIGLLFRFPIPFAGYASGPSAILPAMFAAVLYGIIGGAVVQACMGVVGGAIAYVLAKRDAARAWAILFACVVASALPGLILLAVLDWIIGPW